MLFSHPRSNMSRLLILLVLAFTVTLNAQQLSDAPDLNTGTAPIGASLTKTQTKDPAATKEPSTNTKSTPVVSTPSSTSGGLANAPTLYGVGVPDLVVPDTSGAPFMQTSNLPQGTVFICVGAALGFLGACVIAWRGLVVWSLHRSVRRAAAAKYASEKKSRYPGSNAQTGYSSLYHSANVSMEHLAAGGNTSYKPTSGQRLSKTTKPGKRTSSHLANASSLFYSPTANAAQGGGNKQPGYLPAGYYASGASMPAAGSTMASFGGPASAGYGRLDGQTPPATPGDHQRQDSGEGRRHHRRHSRSGSRGLDKNDNAPVLYVPRDRSERRGTNGQRAPSAMLDELFEHHTGMRDRD